ncbi:hypothetical protein RUM43_005466 [Polyplax serrata]|uniref:Uncharacterized protein n=1 Tax=Polyplax serrata TaxID=468196 RepID=A0AAN8PB90_POLSC
MTTVERTMSTTSTKLTARSSSCSTVSTSRKQNRSQFAKYYTDLCHIQHSHPLSAIKQNLDKGILDFYCDRIKFEEWWSIINALSCDKTLHCVAIRSRHPQKQTIESADTELKAKAVTKQPVVTTRFVLLWLTEAVKMCLSQSTNLTVLELEGLPILGDYLMSITRGLVETTSLQHLSLSKCPIRDEGTEVVCQAIRNLPSIVSLDLSHCGLTEAGAESIAGLIKYQKLNRYSEAWKQTLRYRDPDVEAMPGLRRITVNSNTNLGDNGVNILAEEIKDDLWLRALDVQDCGLTDVGGRLLVDLLESNSNLVIVDGRGNPFMNDDILLEIMNQLAQNNHNKTETEYKWINKNPDLNKKKFQVTNVRPRPWSCQSTTRLVGKAPPPSEYGSGGNTGRPPLIKRSNTTLNGDTWRKNQHGTCDRTKEDAKNVENERLRLQLRDLTLILSQEVRQKLALIEENKTLKEMLEKEGNEKRKPDAHVNKLQIEDDTLKVIEDTISRFGIYMEQKQKEEDKEEEDEEDGASEVTTARSAEEHELPKLVSNLQVILKKAASATEQNIQKTKESYASHKEKIRHSRSETKGFVKNEKKLFIDLKGGDEAEDHLDVRRMALEKNRKSHWRMSRTKDPIIWEEEETSSNCGDQLENNMGDMGKSKAQSMFLKILEGRQNNGAHTNNKKYGGFHVSNSNDEVSSNDSDSNSKSHRKFKRSPSSSNEDSS